MLGSICMLSITHHKHTTLQGRSTRMSRTDHNYLLRLCTSFKSSILNYCRYSWDMITTIVIIPDHLFKWLASYRLMTSTIGHNWILWRNISVTELLLLGIAYQLMWYSICAMTQRYSSEILRDFIGLIRYIL